MPVSMPAYLHFCVSILYNCLTITFYISACLSSNFSLYIYSACLSNFCICLTAYQSSKYLPFCVNSIFIRLPAYLNSTYMSVCLLNSICLLAYLISIYFCLPAYLHSIYLLVCLPLYILFSCVLG